MQYSVCAESAKKCTLCSGPCFLPTGRPIHMIRIDCKTNCHTGPSPSQQAGDPDRTIYKNLCWHLWWTMIITKSLNLAWMWKFSNAFIISGADLIWSPIAISPHSSSCHQPPPPSQPTYAPHPFSVPSTLQLVADPPFSFNVQTADFRHEVSFQE